MLEPKFNSTRSKNKPKSKIKIQHTLILITLCFAFENCAGYLWHLGTGQLDILLKRRSIRSVLQDANTKKELKIKLQQVETFREYGIKELGLNPSSGFKSFVELDRKEIGWHVAACHPLKLESYTWWFPIAGTVPYKGYFDLEKAKEEENKLKEKGFDTRIRITSGYSTLGWFEDPIFSSQLNDTKPYEVASLVFHEMAHATVYFPGDSLFNESYASFIEEEGTLHFLESTEGKESPIKKEILLKKEESKKLRIFLVETASRLQTLYATDKNDSEKLEGKKRILEEFKSSLLTAKGKFKTIHTEKLASKNWNNEDFVGYLRYHSGADFFRKEFEKTDRNFTQFHHRMRSLIDLSNEERKKLLEPDPLKNE
ncbi:aminopeptidase [Leptospira borgpetersenii]|uniref:Aminopeptidase n=1 Tax=Leptospira borgpetersenii serovar Hardjo-bovis (strain JB197) TaxID=355277 RepID=Q04QQ2_LEPBJ|nr:aminopeptidase [Leptospira borgpetersenii]ABJ76768.1 Aminopeptidase [Leptospira borgpetersenii serovar Hardjo-bovis str. JB197]AMX72008.1 aminopeptidase [Leptospira borgpetersenii serovar Hardjo]TQE57741.1 aminopeptidase [Leptospira borgpetersenii]